MNIDEVKWKSLAELSQTDIDKFVIVKCDYYNYGLYKIEKITDQDIFTINNIKLVNYSKKQKAVKVIHKTDLFEYLENIEFQTGYTTRINGDPQNENIIFNNFLEGLFCGVHFTYMKTNKLGE